MPKMFINVQKYVKKKGTSSSKFQLIYLEVNTRNLKLVQLTFKDLISLLLLSFENNIDNTLFYS